MNAFILRRFAALGDDDVHRARADDRVAECARDATQSATRGDDAVRERERGANDVDVRARARRRTADRGDEDAERGDREVLRRELAGVGGRVGKRGRGRDAHAPRVLPTRRTGEPREGAGGHDRGEPALGGSARGEASAGRWVRNRGVVEAHGEEIRVRGGGGDAFAGAGGASERAGERGGRREYGEISRRGRVEHAV